MRTVLRGIHLFIENSESSDNIFISNGDGGEEGRIAKRQRESVCVRGGHGGKGEIMLVIK